MDFPKPSSGLIERAKMQHHLQALDDVRGSFYTGGYYNAVVSGWSKASRLRVLNSAENWEDKPWMAGYLDGLGDAYDLDVSSYRDKLNV